MHAVLITPMSLVNAEIRDRETEDVLIDDTCAGGPPSVDSSSIRRRSRGVAGVNVAAGGVRWWQALHRGDPRIDGHGIVAAGPPPDQD